MTTSVITALLASTIRQGVPILFPAVGETVAERAGVMNIGLEGNMVIGAFTTLLAYQYTQSLFLAILAGALAGCLSAVIIAYIGVSRNQPQAVVGFMKRPTTRRLRECRCTSAWPAPSRAAGFWSKTGATAPRRVPDGCSDARCPNLCSGDRQHENALLPRFSDYRRR